MKPGRANIASLRFVNRWFYLTLRLLLARPLQVLFRLTIVGRDAVPRSGPAFILPNHVALLDPIWLYASLRRPIYMVATEELFRAWFLRMLIRWFGAFPKRKAAQDVYAIKSMFTLIRSGRLVGLYAEGVRTWDGTNTSVIPTVARIIRKFRIPVITCRFDGGYFAHPRWARRWRRIPVRVVFSPLYSAGHVPATDEEVTRDITEAIRIRDHEMPFPGLRKVFRGLPDGISRLLYRCPQCGALESLRSVPPPRKNSFECSSCFSSWRLDITCQVTSLDQGGRPVGEPIRLYDLYHRIRDMPPRAVRSDLVELEDGEQLYLISSPQVVYRERRFPYFRPFAYGRLFLTSRRLLFNGLRGIRLTIPVGEIESLSIEPGNKLHFVYRGRLYRIVFRNASPLKWADAIERLVGRSLTAMA
jgi:1-acyl-sn-glycerol-3-phosphate acyltransferase